MKKILFVVNDADFFISHRLPIAKFLIEKNFEVHLATSGQILEIYNEIGLKSTLDFYRSNCSKHT